MAASAKVKVEKYKRGRSRGGIYTVPSGERCFLAYSKLTFIFCAGEKTISDAVRQRTACWSIDEDTLILMRAKGIRFIGVLCKENNDIWLAYTDSFFDRAQAINHPKCAPGRRYLPLDRFRRRAGKVRFH